MSRIESLDRRASRDEPPPDGPEPDTRRTVAVVGGGITGLVAARRLADSGAKVALFERGSSVGGQLAAVTVAGRQIDVGAESLFTAAPGPLKLIEELGLHDDLIAANPATTWIQTRRGLRALPAGFTPAGPTRLWPVARAGVLSPRGLLRAGLEPLLPATATDGDISVGDYLDSRFGRQVTDRLLDPLLGGLHSGDVRRLSLAAATPQLAALAVKHRSLLLRRRPPARSGPAFVTLRGGMRSLTDHLAAMLGDVEVHLETQVTALRRIDGRTQLTLEGGRHLNVDGVVLATPAHAAAQVVREVSPAAAAELEGLRAASVAVAAFAYPASAAEVPAISQGSGLLVPSSHGDLLKAATFLSTKWSHHSDAEVVFIRASAGRIDDDRARHLDDTELTTRLDGELRAATGMTEAPTDVAVRRWPVTMPQREVGHRQRLTTITRTLADDLPGVTVAGAPYDGPGLASCLRSAEQAAAQVATTLERSA